MLIQKENNKIGFGIIVDFYKKFWSLIPLTVFLIASLARADVNVGVDVDVDVDAKKSSHIVNLNGSQEFNIERSNTRFLANATDSYARGYFIENKINDTLIERQIERNLKKQNYRSQPSEGDQENSLGIKKKTLKSNAPLETVSDSTMSIQHQLLGFQTWNKIQKIKAQNELARLKNKLVRNKTKIKKQEIVTYLEKIKIAEEKLVLAKGLNFDNYLAIFLAQIGGDKERLIEFASKLSKEQVAEVLKRLQKKNQFPDLITRN
ncbi:MAG: hypothetical protein ACI9QD_000997 [Thermoproteota archaeon]|jgi:hypothetical protein